MHHRQAGHRPGQADVQAAQAGPFVRLAVDDRGRLVQDDVVVLQTLGERGRHQRQPGLGRGLLAGRQTGHARCLKGRAQRRNTGLRGDQADRALLRQRLVAGREGGIGQVRRLDRTDLEVTRRLADGGGLRQIGGDGGQQPGRVGDDLARYTEALGELLDGRAGLAQVGQRLLPGVGRPRGGALGDVAEDGRGARRAAAADRAVLHGGEVLRLVEDHMAQ